MLILNCNTKSQESKKKGKRNEGGKEREQKEIVSDSCVVFKGSILNTESLNSSTMGYREGIYSWPLFSTGQCLPTGYLLPCTPGI